MKIASSPLYLDTSALAKLYFPEAESDALESALAGRTDLLVSDLALTEMTSALARRVREGFLAGRDADRIYAEALRDVEKGEFRRLDLTSEVHREAERLLLVAKGTGVPLRSADALHLALAVRARARGLVTYDRTMVRAASLVGSLEIHPVA